MSRRSKSISTSSLKRGDTAIAESSARRLDDTDSSSRVCTLTAAAIVMPLESSRVQSTPAASASASASAAFMLLSMSTPSAPRT